MFDYNTSNRHLRYNTKKTGKGNSRGKNRSYLYLSLCLHWDTQRFYYYIIISTVGSYVTDMMRLEDIYSACISLIGRESWDRIISSRSPAPAADMIPDVLTLCADTHGLPPFISDLVRLELAMARINAAEIPSGTDTLDVNPALEVLPLRWKNLFTFIADNRETSGEVPLRGAEMLLVWKSPVSGEVKCRPATDEDLLVLKMAVEGMPSNKVAAEGKIAVSAVDAAVDRAIKRGILLSPPSLLKRDPGIFSAAGPFDDSFRVTTSFTLQWHITQACDLHCKHCYDRTSRSTVNFRKALDILDDFHDFCRNRHVKGRISFSGGNPLLYPHFLELYRGAADKGFILSILGNPSPRQLIGEIVSIQRPDFFQVSLEGLQKHNDSIRGPGHFERTVNFLELLRELGVYSMVMLTLTQDNIEQILPLGEFLHGLADTFNFNRLSMVGEGAQLKLPGRDQYIRFLESYIKTAEVNPVLGIKDNLINIIRRQEGLAPFGGCTGFGCGAAFNFLALLPDGEVHACRKFPSFIGNINEQGLAEIYDSVKAQRYRAGCGACSACPIRPGCGGCLAAAYSRGLDIFKEKDPYCFFTIMDSNK